MNQTNRSTQSTPRKRDDEEPFGPTSPRVNSKKPTHVVFVVENMQDVYPTEPDAILSLLHGAYIGCRIAILKNGKLHYKSAPEQFDIQIGPTEVIFAGNFIQVPS